MAENYDDVRKQLLAERDRLKRANRRAVIMALIIVAIVIGYFTFIYLKIRQATEPAFLADVIELKINEMVPTITKNIERELIKSSPELARGMIRNCINSAPQVRARAQELILQMADELLTGFREDLDEWLLKAIHEHKADMQELINELKDEEGKKEIAEALGMGIKKSLEERRIQEYLFAYYDILKAIQCQLEYLARVEEPSEEEILHKEIIRTLHTIIRRGLLESKKELEKIKP